MSAFPPGMVSEPILTQAVDRHVSAQPDSDQNEYQTVDIERKKTKSEKVDQIVDAVADDDGQAADYRQPDSPFTVDGQANHLTDGITNASAYYQAEETEG